MKGGIMRIFRSERTNRNRFGQSREGKRRCIFRRLMIRTAAALTGMCLAAGWGGEVLAAERPGIFGGLKGMETEKKAGERGDERDTEGRGSTGDGKSRGGGAYTRGGKTLVLSASDTGAGLAEYPYSYDGGRTWTADPEYEVKESGVYEALVRDAVGNVSRVRTMVGRIDNTGPKVSFVMVPDPWYEGKARLRILAEDGEAGLHERAYSYDGGRTWHFFGQLVLEEPGEIHVLVRDAVGNRTYAVYRAKRQGVEETPRMEKEKGGQKHASGGRREPYVMELLSAAWRFPGLASAFRFLTKFFHTAAGRAVLSITVAGAFLSLAGSLLYAACRGVRVYCYDGRKGYAYLGSALMYEGQDGPGLRITERMEERAGTGEYRLRPGWLLVRFHGGDSLLVVLESGGKQTVAEISKKMDCSFEPGFGTDT